MWTEFWPPPPPGWTIFIPWAWTKTGIFWSLPPHLVHIVIECPPTPHKDKPWETETLFQPYSCKTVLHQWTKKVWWISIFSYSNGIKTAAGIECPRMFKLVNQCWPQIILVKYTYRMWGNQKYLIFFYIFTCHSMARANLNKSKKVLTSTTTASKYIP
jgi:hypothetical protein